YAVSYPFGIIGTIMAILAVRWIFRIDIEAEKTALHEQSQAERSDIQTLALRVTNRNLAGVAVAEIPALKESAAVVSRISRNGVTQVAHPEFQLALGDDLLVVAPPAGLENLRLVIGEASSADLRTASVDVDARRVVVTSRGAL